MPFILFRIARKNWVEIYSSGSEQVDENDLQADALGDLKTGSNELRVWYIDDSKSNLNQVIAELAKDTTLPPDSILIDLQAIKAIGLDLKSNDTINNDHTRWIDKLSAIKLVELSRIIYSAIEIS